MTPARGEFGSAWPLLLGGFIGILVGASSLYFYSLGLFLKPLAAEFGWTRGQASLGPLIGTLCAALASAPTGRLIDRIGAVKVSLGSMCCLAAGFYLMGRATEGLMSFLALTALMSLITAGTSPGAYARVIVAAFQNHRGFALGLILMGTGVGGTLTPLILAPYIETHGWRAGYDVLALIVLCALPIVAIALLHGRDVTVSNRPNLLHAAGTVWTRAFRLLAATFFFAALGVFGVIVHFVPMLMDSGVSPAKAGAIAGIIGVATICSRVATGLLLDRVPAESLSAILFLGSAGGLLILAFGGTGFAVPGAMITGLAIGAEGDLMSYLVAKHLPLAQFGVAYGTLYGLFLFGGALASAIMGFLFDLTVSYQAGLIGSAICLSTAAAIVTRLRAPAAELVSIAP